MSNDHGRTLILMLFCAVVAAVAEAEIAPVSSPVRYMCTTDDA